MKYQGRNLGGGQNRTYNNWKSTNDTKKQNWTSKKYGTRREVFKGTAKEGSQLYGVVIVPGPKKMMQFKDLKDALINEATQLDMQYAATALKNNKDVDEDKIMPERPDKDEYGKTIRKPATDDSGKTIKDGDGEVVMVDHFIVTDLEKKEDLMETYTMKKEEAIKDIRKYGQHKYSLIYKVQGQCHSAINLDWRNQDGYKDAFQDGDLIKCLELLENVCSTHHCSKFKYAPMETVRLVRELSLYKQGSLPIDVYENS